MSFAGKAFLLSFVGYILWIISEPVRLHYRDKYRGRRLGFTAKLITALAVIILIAIAPAYFWWLLLAGFIFIALSRRT